MAQTLNGTTDDQISVDEWLAIRKEAGKKIDPQTAVVTWSHGYIIDPYGVHSDLSDEEKCGGRVYFARSPGSEICVCFYDLTDEIRTELWENMRNGKYNDDDMTWLFGDAE